MQITVVFGVTPIGDGCKRTEEFGLREEGDGAWEAVMDHTVGVSRVVGHV